MDQHRREAESRGETFSEPLPGSDRSKRKKGRFIFFWVSGDLLISFSCLHYRLRANTAAHWRGGQKKMIKTFFW